MSTLMKSSPVTTLRSMLDDFWNTENWFGKNLVSGGSTPAVNIKESEKNFDIEVAAPGFQKEDFKVDISHGVLTISAETQKETKEEEDNYTRREFSYSTFSRSFSLPDTVKDDTVKAKYENGLLRLTLEKSASTQPGRKYIQVD